MNIRITIRQSLYSHGVTPELPSRVFSYLPLYSSCPHFPASNLEIVYMLNCKWQNPLPLASAIPDRNQPWYVIPYTSYFYSHFKQFANRCRFRHLKPILAQPFNMEQNGFSDAFLHLRYSVTRGDSARQIRHKSRIIAFCAFDNDSITHQCFPFNGKGKAAVQED